MVDSRSYATAAKAKGNILHKEQHQNYQFILGYLSPRFCLIECQDHIQWILQRRYKHVERWRGISYFMFKKSMVRVFDEHGLDTDLLETLPERFESRFKTVQSEQRRIHEAIVLPEEKELDAKSFSELPIADDLEVTDHAA